MLTGSGLLKDFFATEVTEYTEVFYFVIASGSAAIFSRVGIAHHVGQCPTYEFYGVHLTIKSFSLCPLCLCGR